VSTWRTMPPTISAFMRSLLARKMAMIRETAESRGGRSQAVRRRSTEVLRDREMRTAALGPAGRRELIEEGDALARFG